MSGKYTPGSYGVLFLMAANDSGPQVAVEMGRQDAVEALVDARVEPWRF